VLKVTTETRCYQFQWSCQGVFKSVTTDGDKALTDLPIIVYSAELY